MRGLGLALLLVLAAIPAAAQEKPRAGGELIFVLPASDPPSYDAHRADILARDIRWYEKHVMGTGPFTFVEHVRGSSWVGRKNPNYGDRGKPYLDGYRALIVRDPAAQLAALRGERAHIQFRGFSAAERDTLVQALGPKVTDPALDELYVKQSRARSVEERTRYLREFERRLLDEEAHYATTLQWHRIVPHLARVRGWTLTPSHYLNHQLDTVWLAD